MNSIFKFFAASLILFNSSLSHAQFGYKDANLSWEKATSYVPGYFFSRAPDNIQLEKKMPVVIFMHGCTGIFTEERNWASFISELGYVVIFPNSFARKERIPNCDSRQKRTGWSFPNAYQYRQEEIEYALSKLKTYSWVDANKIFLMGFSEGGLATAKAPQSDFKGKIILGWTCTNNVFTDLGGIEGPKTTPILAIAFLQDEWRGPNNTARCIDQAEGFDNFTQVDFDGTSHDVYYKSESRFAVKKFLEKNN